MTRSQGHRRVLALVGALLALGAAAAGARDLQTASLGPLPEPAERQADTGAAQAADPLSPFEYAINSVIGRRLNVPGTD